MKSLVSWRCCCLLFPSGVMTVVGYMSSYWVVLIGEIVDQRLS